MTSKNKNRGNQLEREVVNLFNEWGLIAKRAYASNGESLGLHCEVDVKVELPSGQFDRSVPEPNEYIDTFKIQCKRKKKLPDWLGLTENVDAVVIREDRGRKYILLDLEDFISRINNKRLEDVEDFSNEA